MTASALDSHTLRSVCGQFVTGVTVITSGSRTDVAGTTVNSFTSVSLEPPLVLFCLHRRSRLRAFLESTGSFAVNFLAGQQHDLAWAFARKDAADMTQVAHHFCGDGIPVLSDALAYLVCRVVNEIDGGDHLIFLGEVIETAVPRAGHDPLIFFRGVMGALADGPAVNLPIHDG